MYWWKEDQRDASESYACRNRPTYVIIPDDIAEALRSLDIRRVGNVEPTIPVFLCVFQKS